MTDNFAIKTTVWEAGLGNVKELGQYSWLLITIPDLLCSLG